MWMEVARGKAGRKWLTVSSHCLMHIRVSGVLAGRLTHVFCWAVDEDEDSDPSPSTLPPRMRKAWPLPTATQLEPAHENPCDHSKRAESWRAHERWRSPSDVNAESPISVSGAAEGSGKGGAFNPGSLSGDGEDGADGQETEFDTETEADGSDGKCLMPIVMAVLYLVLGRHAANATTADACIAGSDHRFISCSRASSKKLVSPWLHPMGQERCACYMGTTTKSDADACVIRAVEPATQSRHGHACSSCTFSCAVASQL